MTRLYCCDTEPSVKIRENRRRKRFVARCELCGMEEESVNGRHWKAFAKTHRDPADGAGQGTGARRSRAARKRARTGAGKGKLVTATDVLNAWKALDKLKLPFFPARHFTATRYQRISFAFTPLRPNPITASMYFTSAYAFEKLPEPKLEVCAPEVGEIVAWRIWRYVGGKLMALFAGKVWEPGEVMEGDVNDFAKDALTIALLPIPLGIYAHKAICDAHSHAATLYMQEVFRLDKRDPLGPPLPSPVFILGGVKLWGEVVEHETGYRAQYARVLSLDEVLYGDCDLAALRKLYGVEAHDPEAAP